MDQHHQTGPYSKQFIKVQLTQKHFRGVLTPPPPPLVLIPSGSVCNPFWIWLLTVCYKHNTYTHILHAFNSSFSELYCFTFVFAPLKFLAHRICHPSTSSKIMKHRPTPPVHFFKISRFQQTVQHPST